MTIFLRIIADADKGEALHALCQKVRSGLADTKEFNVDPEDFSVVPGAPFAYWVSEKIREAFLRFPQFADEGRLARVGLQTSDDFRFLRTWWEKSSASKNWLPYAKGGGVSLMYQPIPLMVQTSHNFAEIVSFTNSRYPYLNGNARSLMHADIQNFGSPGITWTKSTTSPASFRLLPRGSVYSVSGLGAFVESEDHQEISYVAALMNSRAFKYLLSLSLGLAAEGRKHYEVGLINKNPVPEVPPQLKKRLSELGSQAWVLQRDLDSVNETSHSFLLPEVIRSRFGNYRPHVIEAALATVQAEIDAIGFDAYQFSDVDRLAASDQGDSAITSDGEEADDDEDENEPSAPPVAALLSWAVGVAFGRFDLRIAIGDRAPPPAPNPFDPLPSQSPGMLPVGDEPPHPHVGLLVDEQGHPYDLARLTEEIIARVDLAPPDDARRWLQRDFFVFHLKRYSKSRRKAPIYWPLSTTSGSYTLWVYYPSLTSQTLYTAINDFVEPKLQQVGTDVAALRNKGSARTRDDEKQYETLQAFELELIELRDTLLKLAPNYKPNHNDGVQISAAPLWQLFRHKPWQKVLKDTWAKLEKGEYDWAHLAMNYWPDRVREKCKTDKSLGIAHGLEQLYVEPEAPPKKTRGRKKAGGDE